MYCTYMRVGTVMCVADKRYPLEKFFSCFSCGSASINITEAPLALPASQRHATICTWRSSQLRPSIPSPLPRISSPPYIPPLEDLGLSRHHSKKACAHKYDRTMKQGHVWWGWLLSEIRLGRSSLKPVPAVKALVAIIRPFWESAMYRLPK